MRVLLDTHSVLWLITEDPSLPERARSIAKATSNACFVSAASLWEISIKHSIGKLHLKTGLDHIFLLIRQTGFEVLPITERHMLESAKLPFHHRDPFDRMLVAQAACEDLTVMTKDPQFFAYGTAVVWS